MKRFYTIYIYTLYLLKENEKIENIFRDLLDSKCNDLILSKLYLSEFNSFYKNIRISDGIKFKLRDKLINSSENYHQLLIAFSLTSEFVNKNIVKILDIICQNYGKIYDICFRQKKQILIKNYINYINQTVNDNLLKIQELINIILTNKKQKKYKLISFPIDIFYFFYRKK